MKTKTFWLVFLLLFLSSPVFSQVTSSYVFRQAQFATGTDPVSIAVGDFNGDGRLDLAVANVYNGTGGNTVSVLLGRPDGTFASKATIQPAPLPTQS